MEKLKNETRTKGTTCEIPKVAVVLYNNDFTPKETVMMILIKVFNKNFNEANKITEEIHRGGPNGSAVAGRYVRDVAELKKAEAKQIDNTMPPEKNRGFLRIEIEKE